MWDVHLQTLGLSEKETKVFVSIAELGKRNVDVIAKRCGWPRTSLYPILNSLKDKGLVRQEKTPKTTLFYIDGANAIQQLVERERETLKKKEASAEATIKLLSSLTKFPSAALPKLELFEGKKAIEAMLRSYLPQWKKSYERLNDWTMWGYQDHTFVEQYRKWHDSAWKNRDHREKIHLFSNREGAIQQAKEKIPNREIKILPYEAEFNSSIWIRGDFIVLAMTRETPHFALVLVDSVMSKNLRTVFQLLWRTQS